MRLNTFAGFTEELEKISARRGLKEIAKALKGGNLERAHSLAKTPGVLKASPAGSQIRDLGMGSEGLATLTASPQHGISVRKLYNPKGMASPELIARKEQAGKALQGNKSVAQFYGSNKTQHGGTMHHSEFVPGNVPGTGAKNHAQLKQTTRGVAKGMRQAGFAGAADVRPGNMIQTPQGNIKAIDYIPLQKGEFATGNQRARIGMGPRQKNAIVPIAGKGENVINSDIVPTTPGALKAQQFRGVQAAPKMTSPNPAAAMAPTVPGKGQALPPTKPMRPRG